MKKRIILAILLFSFIPLSILKAQGHYNPGVQSIIGGSQRDDYEIANKVSDGYILAGSTESTDKDISVPSIAGGTDAIITKLDNNLKVMWSAKMGNIKKTAYHDAIETSDGGYVAVGYNNEGNSSSFSDVNGGGSDAAIVKYDKNGNKLWDHLYGGTSTETYSSVLEGYNNEIIAIGYVDTSSASQEVMVNRYDKDGKLIGEYTYGGSDYDVGQSIYKSNDGNYIITARSGSHDGDFSIPSTVKNNSVVLMKVDKNFDIKWAKSYGDDSNIAITDLITSNDGGYVAVGYSNDGTVSKFGHATAYKFTKDGDLVWYKEITEQEATFNKIVPTSDGYLLSGSALTGKGISDTFHGVDRTDAYIAKIDFDGNIIWEDLYGGIGDDQFLYVEQLKDGRYLAIGLTGSSDGDITEPLKGQNDIFTVLLNNIPIITADPEKSSSVRDVLTEKELIDLFNVKAIDVEDGDITDEVVVDQSKVDYNTLGTYDVNFYIKDHSGIVGNEDSIDVKLNIINETPTITLDTPKDVHIWDKQSDADLIKLLNVKALDKEDGDLNSKLVIDQSKVDYDTLGTYDVSFSVTDSGGLNASADATINVINDAPQILGDKSKESPKDVVKTDKELMDLFNIVAMDFEDGDITKDVVVDQSKVNYSVYGDYPVSFTVTDKLGETTILNTTIRIKDLTPELTADKFKDVGLGDFKSDDELKDLFNVKAIDYEEGDLTSKVIVDQSKVNYNKPGKYEVKFYVIDSANNYIEIKCYLTVKDGDIAIKGGKDLIQTGKTNYRTLYFVLVILISLLSYRIYIKKTN